MIGILLPSGALALFFVYVFLSLGAVVLKARRTGVIAGDSLVKGLVYRATEPTEFARLLADKIRRLGLLVVLAVFMIVITWPVLKLAIKV
jgi:hypothetical protein